MNNKGYGSKEQSEEIRMEVLAFLNKFNLGFVYYWQDVMYSHKIPKLTYKGLYKLSRNALDNIQKDIDEWKLRPISSERDKYIHDKTEVLNEFKNRVDDFYLRYL